MPPLSLKCANGFRTSYDNTFDKVLNLFDQKYHFLDTFDTKTQKLVKKTNPKPLTQNAKTKVVPLLTLKSANGLKTIYIDTFDKVLDLFDQKYHFLETFDTKTQKLV